MERDVQNSQKLGHSVESDDTKYVSGLSTILVATIQETKDRISQIEYIFCSQLYPTFQSKSKSVQKIYHEARKAADDMWKEKENNLLLQMAKLERERHQALKMNHSLNLEKENSLKEKEEKMKLLLLNVKTQQLHIDGLEKELTQKSKEVDEERELQNKLYELVQSNTATIKNKDMQLKDHEEKTTMLLGKLNSLENKVNYLQEELRGKTEEVEKGVELREKLVKNIELQASEIMDKESLLNCHEKKQQQLVSKLEHQEKIASNILKELDKKTNELFEGRVSQKHLLQQTDYKGLELSREKMKLPEYEKENNIWGNHSESSQEVARESDWKTELLKEIELKSSEIEAEKKKRRDVVDAYKRLKSQYNYLSTKFGLTTDSMLPRNKLEDDRDSLKPQQNPKASPVGCDINKVKNEIISENFEGEKGCRSVQSFHPSNLSSHKRVSPVEGNCLKSAPAAGTKRLASSWRDTRSGQNNGGRDPHDDFLDTPFENIIGNLNKALNDEVHDHPIPPSKGMDIAGSDDETQDMNVDPGPQKQQKPVPKAGQTDFKYVEPVRKKADRENLKGIDCKQCKKFYDAVLPSNTDGNTRCEHHNGVSRHRYKYAPPSTPDGFWNIGFESEM